MEEFIFSKVSEGFWSKSMVFLRFDKAFGVNLLFFIGFDWF